MNHAERRAGKARVVVSRFSLSRRSALDLALRRSSAGTIQLSLHDDRGRRLESGETIARTSIAIDGRRSMQARPGASSLPTRSEVR